MKFEIVDDGRVQKRDGVGGDRIAKAGMKFLRRRRTADLRAALKHRHREAGHGEIGRGDEAVVTAADHDNVRHQGAAGGSSQRPSSGALRHLLPGGEGGPPSPHSPSGDGRPSGHPFEERAGVRESLLPPGEGGPKGRMRAYSHAKRQTAPPAQAAAWRNSSPCSSVGACTISTRRTRFRARRRFPSRRRKPRRSRRRTGRY